jgi:hypothetical protein
MSGQMIPAGNGQYVVVVRGWGAARRSNLLSKEQAIRLLCRLTFKKRMVEA